MKTKEELVQKNIVDIIATCVSISKINPRAVDPSKSPLTKSVRGFSRAFEEMDKDEMMDMARTFYSSYYLEAIDDNNDWMNTGNVFLVYGDKDLNFKLRVSDYYRVAKDIDANSNNKRWTTQIQADVYRLLIRLASPAMAEKLDEKLMPLEGVSSRSSNGVPGASASSSSSGTPQLPPGLSNIGDMLQNVMSGFSKMNESGGPSIKDMFNNPQARAILENVTSAFPPEISGHMKKVVENISDGNFNMQEALASMLTASKENEQITEDQDVLSEPMSNLIDIEDDASSSQQTQQPSVICDDEVCHIQH